MILCHPRRDRIRLIDGVNADRCRFVRTLSDVISNEFILVLKKKTQFHSFQYILFNTFQYISTF